ncbi:MAG: patatin-like phospholipase family protein [Clostridia bacterium]|nr:patatin-like phospholipase family protein [Clostridia bacterium]
MYGVALEGGGTKGAYHIGAMKAIFECGFDIGAIVGTSIGSFNAAVIAQGDFEKLFEKWYNADSSMAIDIDIKELTKVNDKKIDINSLKYWYNFVSKNVSNGGIDTTKLKELYAEYIDEEKLRKSKIEYGLVTVSLTDKKPVYIFKENIPQGKVVDYVLASSYLPVFKQQKLVDGKTFIDGGFYDNCPLKLLIDKKYVDIFEIRTEAIGFSRKINRKGLNIYTITPSKDLGNLLFTDNQTVRRNILMGYYDAIRVIKGYIGEEYYVIPEEDSIILDKILNITDENILDLAENIKLSASNKHMEPKKLLFEKILPQIGAKVSKKDTSSYQRLIVAVLEEIATNAGIEQYKLYTFKELLKISASYVSKEIKKEQKMLIKNDSKILMLKFIKILNSIK